MTEQPTLFTPPAPTGDLTERQRFVYDQLLAHSVQGDGLTADEVGALLCERAGRHDAGTRCQWDTTNGQGVLKALRKKGLARKPRGSGWRVVVAPEPESAQNAEVIPF